MNNRRKINIIKNLLAKSCPDRIPISGTDAEKNDCFVVTQDKNGEPYLFLQKITSNSVECLRWNGKQYKDVVQIDVSDIDKNKLNITHYYKTSIIEFTSILDFKFNQYTKFVYKKEDFKRFKAKLL